MINEYDEIYFQSFIQHTIQQGERLFILLTKHRMKEDDWNILRRMCEDLIPSWDVFCVVEFPMLTRIQKQIYFKNYNEYKLMVSEWVEFVEQMKRPRTLRSELFYAWKKYMWF